MSFILSDQRDSPGFSSDNFRRYQQYLDSLAERFPKSAYALAISDWWYSVEDPRAPHDSALLDLRMNDVWGCNDGDPQFCSLTLNLQSANEGIIRLKYLEVREYDLRMPRDISGIHGDWQYDEFTLSDDGLLVHTIEWGNGAIWTIKTTDVIHKYITDDDHNAARPSL
jgi:hypothetical protein